MVKRKRGPPDLNRHKELRLYIRRSLLNRGIKEEEIDDMTSEVLFRLVRGHGEKAINIDLIGLFIERTCIDYYRKSRRKGRNLFHFDNTDLDEVVLGEQDSEYASIVRVDFWRIVARALTPKSGGENGRTQYHILGMPILLMRVLGYGDKEMARRLGVNIHTIESAWQYIRARIREEYEKIKEEEID